MRVFIKSFGCSTNQADGEVLAGCLAEAGYSLVDSPSSASVIIYNTCAVKGPTEDRMIGMLKRAPSGKKLIVTGCLPMINLERLNSEVHYDGIIGPAAGDRIIEITERVLRGEIAVNLQDTSRALPSLSLPRIRLNPVISIIPISYGCLGSCSYCCVAYARGSLRSYSAREIVQRAKKDLASGAQELWLTSQDTACYGRDKNTNLADLLHALCSIRRDFRIRVGMMTPNTAMVFLRELTEAFRNKHVFKFIHLPIQSGDDEVLERMRRFYTADDFKRAVNTFRQGLPEITLSTDVICGFPGEGEKAFERTLKLIREVKPDIVNVSKFFARPKTPAARMQCDFIPAREMRLRSARLARLAKKVALEKNRKWLGWTGKIIVDEAGKVPRSWIGRNAAYKPIVVKSGDGLLGKTVDVKVARASATFLEARLI